MLNKKNKIYKKKETEDVFRGGKSSFNNFLGVRALKTDSKDTRFVIVVSARVSKKAVERNKIKRQLNEVARLNLKLLQPGYDFFILALPPIINKNFHEIEGIFLFHCKKLKTTILKTQHNA